ncbi:family 20 glycosylhydrolase [Mucilaginibacter calamicampi]|uniref:beta-N-acetylhexosaminidase n=1 Tax=Mucilaginibacter calamicampi TaxID=1302352 RepID=A0ABW2YTB7_9SPHI
MLKRARLFLGILSVFFTTALKAQDTDPNMGIIPAPVSVKKNAGNFVLSGQTTLLADSIDNKAVLFLADYLQNKIALRVQPKQNSGQSNANSLVLTSIGSETLPADGYRLSISPQNITIIGKGAGLFYGIQTLIQLIPTERAAAINIPCALIEDFSRFKYRGFMLDVSRHFFSVETVKKYIDLMATYKLNNFHWHLSDDQGWRVEIKKYPKLTEIASKRAETLIGNYHDRQPQQFDSTPYGGFYTQEEIRDVVRYAAAKYINIIPEIDMPGHSKAALTAYPEFGCNAPDTYTVSGTWSERHDVFCPTEATFTFLQDILTELMALFPGKYIHIGGDEVAKDDWKANTFSQQLIKRLKLKDEKGLQSYFMRRMEEFVNSKGRVVIGWDEILEGGLPPKATIMSWRGEAGGIAAAQQNHEVIMAPSNQALYLDHTQGTNLNTEPVGIGGNAPIQKTYAYNPTPAQLTPDQQKYIIGVQANLWNEYIATPNKVEYMLLPRFMALSEIAWTPLANKNFTDFMEVRIPQHLAILEKNNYNYRVPTAIGGKDTIMFGSQLSAQLKPSVKGAKVYYTIDGYTPNETDLEYKAPISLSIPLTQYRELQTVVITPGGKRSNATKTVVYNKTPFPPVEYTANRAGLLYQLFPGNDFTNVRQLSLSTAPFDTLQVVKSFNTLPFRKIANSFGVIYSGYLRADEDGVYGFSTLSDDGSMLYIDDVPVVDNDGRHSPLEKGGAVPLQKGFHKITIKYIDVRIPGKIQVFMTMPGKPKGELSPESLFY